jgi:hypothetical protein
MRRIHGDDCRVALISYVPPAAREAWLPDHHVLMTDFGWPTTGMNEFVQRVAARDHYLDGYQFRDPWTSSNGCVRLCLGGMKSALLDHGNDIITFLDPNRF